MCVYIYILYKGRFLFMRGRNSTEYPYTFLPTSLVLTSDGIIVKTKKLTL